MSRKRIFSALMLAAIAIQGCTVVAAPEVNPSANRSTVQASQTPLLSKDGKTQILLPPGWSDARKASTSKNFSIKVSDRSRDLHLNVSTQPHLAGVPLADITAMTVTATKKAMPNARIERTSVKQINGYTAVQYKLQGIFFGSDATLVLTGIETPNHYHFITAASPTRTFGQYQPELQQIIQSFKEVKTQASSH